MEAAKPSDTAVILSEIAAAEPVSSDPQAQATAVETEASAPSAAPPTIAVLTSMAPAAGASSPGALLAASLVRSRASYFERLSSGSKASTSGSPPGGCPLSAVQTHTSSVLGTRCSTPLAAHPLDPLAPHPLSRSGSEEFRVLEPDLGSDSDMETDSVDNFFHKPSYTRYGSNVELSAATSYRKAASCGGGSSSHAGPSSGGGGGSGASINMDRQTSGVAPSEAPDMVRSGGSGYVRTVSARFGRMSGSAGGGKSNAGLDGLFDDLVTHVGALLASHPDVEAQMGMVQGLSDRLLELHALCETLGRKEDEVEHLRGVLRELTMTRAEAIRLKVQMAESLNGLQQEYYRVLRSAQLAQGTCKQHSAKAAATRKQLVETQSELVRYKRAVAVLRERNRRLRADNEDMAVRLQALEQVQMGNDVRRSACYMAIVQSQTAVLY